ncbi:unnamed protein product [Rhizoctonia solani]|uniref:FAS1 domain-containing protein n=1 Tax=Rhizoctonia solani TaxID=456999 RepID=A0A8H3H7D0_9AGAM|nr:unnamed protein product [Rhizoctonia solani]
MQLATLTILAIVLVSQGQAMRIATRQDFMNGLIEQLNSQNRTSFSAALSQAASSGTPQGEQLVTNLMATDRTLLAPLNEMFDPLIQGQDNATVANLVSYHLMNESVNMYNVVSSNISRRVSTFLTDPKLVNLGPGNGQVQCGGVPMEALSCFAGLTVTSQYQNNLVLHMIDAPIPPPGDLQQTLGKNLTGAPINQFAKFNDSLRRSGSLGSASNSNQARSTILAPFDPAWQNNKELKRIIHNHVINSNVLYSYHIDKSPNATSVSGGKLRFAFDKGEMYITSGNIRARVIRSDIPVKNGVIHVIDKVLMIN